jgi:hypothetical protein
MSNIPKYKSPGVIGISGAGAGRCVGLHAAESIFN